MIALGCDHGGYDLKEQIKSYLQSKAIAVEDFGCHNKESVDYPLFGKAVAVAVAEGKCEKGIVICTTGVGISIAANKVRGIRCALCSDTLSAQMTRQHNDANLLALGAGIVGPKLAEAIVDIFLETPFEGGRHARRVGQLMEIEEG